MRGYPNTAATLWSHVLHVGECWEFQGTRRPSAAVRQGTPGYGVISYQGQNWPAHRLAWTLTNGPIPDGLWVLHRCDNPPCIRPSHLYVGTNADNMRDMIEHGRGALRAKSGESNPSARLTADKVRLIRELAASGSTHRALGQQFGVSHQTVTKIVLRRKWPDVA